MVKRSYSLKDLDKNSIKEGELRIGNLVTPTRIIMSNDQLYYVYPDTYYKVVGFLPQDEYPGGFIIEVNGRKWGFWFDKQGLAQYFKKVVLTKQELMEERYGELPYKILTTLEEKGVMSVDEIVDTVINQKLSVPPEELKKVKTDIIKTIYALQELQFIAVTRIVKDKQKTYAITQKGKQYLEME